MRGNDEGIIPDKTVDYTKDAARHEILRGGQSLREKEKGKVPDIHLHLSGFSLIFSRLGPLR